MSSTTNYERDNSTISSSKDEMPTKITTMSEYEKRMEVNRVRAKEIRKRKKKMEEDMRQQIVKLTLENNRLRIQKKMQEVEIQCLRKERYQQQTAMSMFNQHGGMNPLMVCTRTALCLCYDFNLLPAGLISQLLLSLSSDFHRLMD